MCNRNLSVLTSMPFDGTLSGGKCYGLFWRCTKTTSFWQLSERFKNRERTEKYWNHQHSRIFAKKPIHEAGERLKESRSCDGFFVDILFEQADLYSVVFCLDIQIFCQVLFAQEYSVRLIPIYMFLAITTVL